ncbi:MAG: O-antigen ligase family protein [Thermoanaerobaculia bacterium]
MDGRRGRLLPLAACAARAALALALLALAFAALRIPWQPAPISLLVIAAVVLGTSLARPHGAVLLTAGTLALLPILGNLVAGPWVAPAELVLLLLAAAALLLGALTGAAAPLPRALALSTAAMAAGAIAATLAAVAPTELLPAVRELASSFFSAGSGHAAAPLRAALVHACGLLGFVLFRRVAAARGEGTPLAALVGGLALVGAFAVIEAAAGLKLWSPPHYEAISGGLRVPATLPDYNATGAAMVLGLFPALALAYTARGARRLAWGLAAGLLVAGLLLTGSRTAWLAALLAGSATLLGALHARRREARGGSRRLLLGAGLAAGLAVAAVAAWPGDVGALLRRRAATLLEPEAALKAVRAGRVGFWTAGARMVAEHPVAGIGPGRVPARFGEFCDPAFPVRTENLHNYYLQAVAENGVPGGLLVLLPFVPLALLLGRSLASGAAAASPAASLAPGLLAFAATGLASHPWLLPELQFLFWGAAALLPGAVAGPLSEARFRRASVLALATLAAWGGTVLLSRPGEERGRWGAGEWSAEGTEKPYFWVGPRALVPAEVPEAERLSVRLRGMQEGLGRRPLVVALRLDGGPVRKVSVTGRAWQDVVVERGPLRPGSVPSRSGLLAVEASRGFSPAREGRGDRRVLALQLARPPVRPAAEPPP